MSIDIIARLRADFGQKTLGQLLQDREAAAHEIERLRLEIKALKESKSLSKQTSASVTCQPSFTFNPGSLLSAADICKLLRISRSAFYLRRSQNGFPQPIQLAPGTVRYETDAIIAWYKGLSTKQ